MPDLDQLGTFYLGRLRDAASGQTTDTPLLYDSRDLTTHAVCVGMTGSGKTGLCLDLLEEAALDGIPAIIVDPKGDLGNLLLTFPDLAPADFRPWVQAEEAARKNLSLDEFAAAQAAKWKQGLADWGQSGDRVRKLRDAAEFVIYTPGSEAGRPVSIVASFAAPPAELVADTDLFRDRIATTAAGLLGLLGIDADPLQSREHILLANLFEHAWRAGRSYDLASLIRDLQKPPFTQVGVLDLERFLPEKERFGLAMSLNNLLAAPGFDVWMQGEPLDVGSLLYGANGKPRHAIFSIAHLSDSERMFFVTLLLDQLVGWMRGRPGTSSLRAVFYMDEIFGYLPPVANPPSKRPLLTLLKQGRAFGLGVVLATQNPVDLDYKALANMGTWFLGRLQTERDKLRMLDGLEGAAAAAGGGFDRAAMETLLSGLQQRVFVLHDVHEAGPLLFESRWAMSYLAGPLTRDQIRRLSTAGPRPAGAQPASPPPPTVVSALGAGAAGARPIPPIGLPEVFLQADPAAPSRLTYAPRAFAEARLSFSIEKAAPPVRRELRIVTELPQAGEIVDWLAGTKVEAGLADGPVTDATFVPIPTAGLGSLEAFPKARLSRWEKDLAKTLQREERLELVAHEASGTISKPGETERDFRVRLTEEMRARRDQAVQALRQKYAPKVERLDEKIATANRAVAREQAQASSQKVQSAIAVGNAVLAGFFGRRGLSSRMLGSASSAARGWSRSAKEEKDVAGALDNVTNLQQQRVALVAELESAVADLAAQFDLAGLAITPYPVAPMRGGVEVLRVALGWAPYRAASDGSLTPAWR